MLEQIDATLKLPTICNGKRRLSSSDNSERGSEETEHRARETAQVGCEGSSKLKMKGALKGKVIDRSPNGNLIRNQNEEKGKLNKNVWY